MPSRPMLLTGAGLEATWRGLETTGEGLAAEGLPGGSGVKNMSANAGEARDPGSIPGSGRSPGEGNSNSLQYPCLENPHGQRSLAGYSPWGRKKSDTTERLILLLFLEEGLATHSSILAWRIPMDRGAWWATVHEVTKSQTQLSD